MKKIRSKIILILILIVLLPLIPMSFLVYNLVNQSYHIGVNPRVGKAIEDGLDFSKKLYDRSRWELSQALERLSSKLTMINTDDFTTEQLLFVELKIDSSFWKVHSLMQLDELGNQIWIVHFDTTRRFTFDKRILSQFQFPNQKNLVVSNRDNNIFTAVHLIEEKKDLLGYLVLFASMQSEVLLSAERILNIHQVYQALDLEKVSLMRSFLYVFIAIAGIFLSLAIVFGVWISSRITAPITMLVDGTTEIGRGNLDYRLPALNRNDELGQLLDQFNLMAEQLKENQERLIYLQKMAAWQLMARKMAHEIKNPLTPIQLTLQQLVDEYNGSDQNYQKLLDECSHIINEEIGSLRQLVTEFSEFGRLPEFKPQMGDLNHLIEEIGALYGNRLELKLDEHLGQFLFDQDRIRRVFINLIENAIQADPGGQKITISNNILNDTVILVVEDKGEGISQGKITEVFEPYFSTKKSGSGLGLAITRMIVEEHKGSISVESQSGEGTKFIIKLPYKLK